PTDTLQNVNMTLKAVVPGSGTTPSPYLTVLDSPKLIGDMAPGATGEATFTVRAANSIAGRQQADMVIGMTASLAGKDVESTVIQRENVNVDETAFYYSTDFPTGGGPLNYDVNNNEVLETVTNDPRNFFADYIFETQTYSDMTAGGFNTTAGLKAP